MLDENEISRIIIGESIALHRDPGPGLLESVYQHLLAHRLRKKGLRVEIEVPIPLVYDSQTFEIGFRADMIVEGRVMVELKSIDALAPVHAKKLLTYLRLANMHLGLLINFGQERLVDGIERVLNGFTNDVSVCSVHSV